jgi:prepilin-type N-terminal cleavage/methylation domain-containing protein
MPGRSSSRGGFTLLELLIVLVLISLCAATTVRWYFSHGDVTLENAAILLARDVRAAQHRSIFLGEKSLFVFLSDGSGYSVLGAAGEPAHNPQTDEPFLRVYSDDGVFKGVTVLEVDAGGDRTLEIDGRGLPLEDLTVTLAYHDDRRTVLLDRKSSEITIAGTTSGWIDHER